MYIKSLGLPEPEQRTLDQLEGWGGIRIRHFSCSQALNDTLNSGTKSVVVIGALADQESASDFIASMPQGVALAFMANGGGFQALFRQVQMRSLRVAAILPSPCSLATWRTLCLSSMAVRDAESDECTGQPKALFQDLGHAIAQRDIFPVVQPKVSSHTSTLRGFEVLARWQHPTSGPVGPDSFVPDAEAAELIHPLTLIVWEPAIRWFGEFRESSYENTGSSCFVEGVNLYLNVSQQSVGDHELFEKLLKACRLASVPPARVCLQFEASKCLQAGVASLERLSRIREYGFMVALDRLDPAVVELSQYVEFLPMLAEVSLDKSVVLASDLDSESDSQAVKACSELASQNVTVTAMGVADRETFRMLHGVGVELAQGYLIASPLKLDDAIPWFKKREKARELERLDVLHALGLLDTPQSSKFDRWTLLARRLFGVPMALISLVDVDRQWFKSSSGHDLSQTDRQEAICSVAIESDQQLIIENAAEDAFFCTHPAVTRPQGIRFYAGQPLALDNGFKVGTFCLIDVEARSFDRKSKRCLEVLGRLAVLEIQSPTASSSRYPDGAIDLMSERASTISEIAELCSELGAPPEVLIVEWSNVEPTVPESVVALSEHCDFSAAISERKHLLVFVARRKPEISEFLDESGARDYLVEWQSTLSQSFLERLSSPEQS